MFLSPTLVSGPGWVSLPGPFTLQSYCRSLDDSQATVSSETHPIMDSDSQKPHLWDYLKDFQTDVQAAQPVGKPHFSVVVIAYIALGFYESCNF